METNIFFGQLWGTFYNLKNTVHKIVEPIMQELNLTPVQAYILFGIKMKNFKNISGVCRKFNINQGNVSTVCKKMEREGLITRVRSASDERIVTLSLTEKGLEKLKKLEEKFHSFEVYCAGLPYEKINAVINGFEHFEEILASFIKFNECEKQERK